MLLLPWLVGPFLLELPGMWPRPCTYSSLPVDVCGVCHGVGMVVNSVGIPLSQLFHTWIPLCSLTWFWCWCCFQFHSSFKYFGEGVISLLYFWLAWMVNCTGSCSVQSQTVNLYLSSNGEDCLGAAHSTWVLNIVCLFLFALLLSVEKVREELDPGWCYMRHTENSSSKEACNIPVPIRRTQ